LGRRLVERTIARAREQGIRRLFLLTTTAADYFPRLGFARIDRADVPAEVAATVEFTSACPASAIAMSKSIP
jgi:amino-acid N-acetyltransferase